VRACRAAERRGGETITSWPCSRSALLPQRGKGVSSPGTAACRPWTGRTPAVGGSRERSGRCASAPGSGRGELMASGRAAVAASCPGKRGGSTAGQARQRELRCRLAHQRDRRRRRSSSSSSLAVAPAPSLRPLLFLLDPKAAADGKGKTLIGDRYRYL